MNARTTAIGRGDARWAMRNVVGLGEAVDTQLVPACGVQVLGQVAPDEAGCSWDQCSHDSRSFPASRSRLHSAAYPADLGLIWSWTRSAGRSAWTLTARTETRGDGGAA